MAASAGCMIWRTENIEESCEWLKGLYRWWTVKDFDQHRAHAAFYTPQATVVNPFAPPSLVQKVATVLPRLGVVKAQRVEEKFKTVLDMINADEAQWQDVKGIGAKDAATIHAAIRRES